MADSMTAPVTVTQADIECAEQVHACHSAIFAAGIIARHRTAAEAASAARVAELVEALERIRDCTTKHGGAASALRIINETLARAKAKAKGEQP